MDHVICFDIREIRGNIDFFFTIAQTYIRHPHETRKKRGGEGGRGRGERKTRTTSPFLP